MGLSFFPRGGSAFVVRGLCRALPSTGWGVRLVAGSLGEAGASSHAPTFFAGIDVLTVEIGAHDPRLPGISCLPTYEERAASGERLVTQVDRASYESMVEAWRQALDRARAGQADVLHLHHLTALHEAAARAFPSLPVVTHLHGTELRLLERIREGPPPHWTEALAWDERMTRWAEGSARIVVPSHSAARRTRALFDVPESRIAVLRNGVDTDVFERRPLGSDERVAHWHRWLAEAPRGWRPGGEAGSVRYSDEELRAFCEGGPVLLYVGRFTESKRLPLLIRALERARTRLALPAPLVIVGGYPGECEGAHPLETIEASGAENVFLAGWRNQQEVAQALNAADLLVLPSAQESFGLVLVEAMACGVAVVASDRGGPATIVGPGEAGWLFPADDELGFADTLVEALGDPAERRARADRGYARARAHYTWTAVARGLASLYDDVLRPQDDVTRVLGRNDRT